MLLKRDETKKGQGAQFTREVISTFHKVANPAHFIKIFGLKFNLYFWGLSVQLQIDFSGKKTEKITISASEELKQTLELLSRAMDGIEISKLAGEYVAECAARDLGKLMILQARGKAPLNMSSV